MGRVFEARREFSLSASLLAGIILLKIAPFPSEDWLFLILREDRPTVYYLLAGLYHLFLFTTPFWVGFSLLSLAYILRRDGRQSVARIILPPRPDHSQHLCLVIGERHQMREPGPVARPEWVVISERGLFTGIAIIGAIGSGKTSCCIYPFAEQILTFGGSDKSKHIGGLVLEVKGDLCHKVRGILSRAGREEDYIEINLTGSPYRYNPLHNELDSYALAFGIATLLTSLFGRGREPFWQQAYTNMVKFVILLHKRLYGYVTLFDVYECAINPDLLSNRIKLAEDAIHAHQVAAIDLAV